MTKELLYAFFAIQQSHSGISHLWPSIDLRNQENIIIVFQSLIKAKKSERKYSFGNNIYNFFRLYPQYILISINILFVLFSHFVLLISQDPKFTKFVRTELLESVW